MHTRLVRILYDWLLAPTLIWFFWDYILTLQIDVRTFSYLTFWLGYIVGTTILHTILRSIYMDREEYLDGREKASKRSINK